MQVLDQQDERLHLAQRQVPCRENLERALALDFRHRLGPGIRHGNVDAEQSRDHRQRLGERLGQDREATLELRDLVLRGVVRLEREPLFEQLDHREEWCRLRVGGCSAFEPGVRLGGETGAQLPCQARLPDTRLARQEHVLSVPLRHLLPAVEQRAELHLAADERRQPIGREVEAAAHAARLHHAVELHRLAHAFELLRSAVLDDEHPRHEALGSGRAEEDDVLVLGDEAAGGELEDEAAVHLLVEGEVEGVDGFVAVAKLRLFEAAGEEAIGAPGELVLDEQRQRVGERELVGLGLDEAGLERLRHAAEAELAQRAEEFRELHRRLLPEGRDPRGGRGRG
jgi:hypothetical protein